MELRFNGMSAKYFHPALIRVKMLKVQLKSLMVVAESKGQLNVNLH